MKMQFQIKNKIPTANKFTVWMQRNQSAFKIVPLERSVRVWIIKCVPAVVSASNQMRWYANEPEYFTLMMLMWWQDWLRCVVLLLCVRTAYHHHRCAFGIVARTKIAWFNGFELPLEQEGSCIRLQLKVALTSASTKDHNSNGCRNEMTIFEPCIR